jgi:uncharacterized membrane protein
MLKATIPYFTFEYDVDFLLTKQNILHFSHWRYAFYLHISFCLFILPLGAIQFIKIKSLKWKKVHKILGKIYVTLVLFICAPSGLIMALHANGGIAAKISFTITAILWWYFTIIAYFKIRERNWYAHQAYMIRSYALTLSAITLRLYVLFLPKFIPLQGAIMYVTVAWLSWIPNLIFAEFIIYFLQKRRKQIDLI